MDGLGCGVPFMFVSSMKRNVSSRLAERFGPNAVSVIRLKLRRPTMQLGAKWLAIGITAMGLSVGCASTQSCQCRMHEEKGEMMEREKGAEQETKVTIDQLPAAVKQTLMDETKGGTIGEIAKETKHDKVAYEADAKIEGKDYEIKVAEDGTLLGKKLENKKGEKKCERDKD